MTRGQNTRFEVRVLRFNPAMGSCCEDHRFSDLFVKQVIYVQKRFPPKGNKPKQNNPNSWLS